MARSRGLLRAEAEYFGLFPPHALLMWEVVYSRPKTEQHWYNYHHKWRQLGWIDDRGRWHTPCQHHEDHKMAGGRDGPFPEPIDWAAHLDHMFPPAQLDKLRAEGWTVTIWNPAAEEQAAEAAEPQLVLQW